MKTVWKKLTEKKYEIYAKSSKGTNPIGYIYLVGKEWKLDVFFTIIPEIQYEVEKTFDSWHEAGLHLTKLWIVGRAYKDFDFFSLEDYDKIF
tara:strand:- start:81 stop:356 length:276 start_codon:yes stop_codon:yes gene_type:complete